jgi:hypothetical protein
MMQVDPAPNQLPWELLTVIGHCIGADESRYRTHATHGTYGVGLAMIIQVRW